MKKTAALLLILALCLSVLAGCGDAKMTGRYDLVSMKADGKEILADFLKAVSANLGDEFNENDYKAYIEFINASKCKMAMFVGSQDGKYKLDGDTLEIIADGETLKMTLDGNKITYVVNGSEMVFEKK
jgi:hypothetical protein